MRIRSLCISFMGLILMASSFTLNSYADTPLSVVISKAGNGTTTLSSSLTIQLKISGGNSVNYSTCASFFQQNQDLKFALTSETKEGSQQDSISNFQAKTLSISPTELNCEFSFVPTNYFGYSWKFLNSSVNLTIKIVTGANVLSQKTITMTDESTIQPSLTITSPLRGSSVSGDFSVTTKIENSSLWNPETTMAGAFVGATSSCFLPVGNFKVSKLNSPNRTTVSANQYTGSSKQMIVTQQSANTFRYQFFDPGQYTICIWQSFTSSADLSVKSNGGDWVTAAVVVNVSSAVTNLTYEYNDPIFKKLYGSPYNFVFKCPSNVPSTSSTYECSVQAQSKLTSSDLRDLGLTGGTTVKVTGSISLIVCEYNRDNIRVACQDDPSLVPDYFVKTYRLNVGFEEPVKFSVTNYLNKTGYTGVEISGNSQQGDPDSSFAWKMNDYDAKKRQAANAPPSASYQANISKAIRSGMNSKCQKLPSGFSKYLIKYSKKITSNDGLPGFIFVINSRTNLQVFDLGNSWQFGPSKATSDQITWRNWGCGGAILVY